jgi:hypothetical protein
LKTTILRATLALSLPSGSDRTPSFGWLTRPATIITITLITVAVMDNLITNLEKDLC